MYQRFAIAVLCFSVPFAAGQTAAPPAFEVASFKPAVLDPLDRFDHIEAHPGSLIMRNVSIRSCVKWAYNIQLFQISGSEKLPGGEYEILAKAQEGTPVPRMRLMMQALLADRFKLAAHRETKQTKCYALVVAKQSRGLHASDSDSESSMAAKDLALNFSHTNMAELADVISFQVGTVVIDRTGLQGRFDFTIDLSAYVNSPRRAHMGDANKIVDATQKQLGLKLESTKLPIEMLVIDRIGKVPTGN